MLIIIIIITIIIIIIKIVRSGIMRIRKLPKKQFGWLRWDSSGNEITYCKSILLVSIIIQ